MALDRRDVLLGAGALAALHSFPALAQAQKAVAVSGDAELTKLLAAVAEELLAEYPENATALGLDKDARAALKSQAHRPLAARARAGSRRRGGRLARLRGGRPGAAQTRRRRSTSESPRPRTELARRGLPLPLWRRRHPQPAMVVPQRALCRRPEYRRLRRDAGLPRQQPFSRQRGRRRSLSRPARSLCRRARRRDRAAPPRRRRSAWSRPISCSTRP